MTNEIEQALQSSGFQDHDIKLAQKLTRRGLESHLHLIDSIKDCERCALSLDCYGQTESPLVTSQRVIGTGPWNSPLMVIADMPGVHEEKYGVPFVGEEGQILTMILAKAGIDRNSIYMTYAIKCAATRQPTDSEVQQCSRHIQNELLAVNPKVVLTFGELSRQMVNSNSVSIPNARNQVWQGPKQEMVHTHSISKLLQTDNQQQYKSEVWNDVSLAVKRVKELRPHYVYDRVGLHEL